MVGFSEDDPFLLGFGNFSGMLNFGGGSWLLCQPLFAHFLRVVSFCQRRYIHHLEHLEILEMKHMTPATRKPWLVLELTISYRADKKSRWQVESETVHLGRYLEILGFCGFCPERVVIPLIFPKVFPTYTLGSYPLEHPPLKNPTPTTIKSMGIYHVTQRC